MTTKTIQTAGKDAILVSADDGLVWLDLTGETTPRTMMCEGLKAAQARELARALLEAADDILGVQRQSVGTDSP